MGRKKTMHDKKKRGHKRRSSSGSHRRSSSGGGASAPAFPEKALPLCVVAPAAFWSALSGDDVPANLNVDFEATPAPESATGFISSTSVTELLQWFAKGVAAADAATAAARLEFAATLTTEERAAVHMAVTTAGLGAVLESWSEGEDEQRFVTASKKGHAPTANTTAAGPPRDAADLVAQARKMVDEGRAWVAEHAGIALYAGATTLAAGVAVAALSIARRR